MRNSILSGDMLVKLGIQIPLEFFSPSQAVQAAVLAETHGFDHVVVNDHIRLPQGLKVAEAWTVLAAIAVATKRIRLGTCVSPLPLRHPLLLAKMAASVDQLSGGRLIMGVGAGWHRDEFEWLGVPFYPHAERLAQTEEALQLIQQLWTKSTITFTGRFYQVSEVVLEPKPVQRPHPPFFLGGGSLQVLDLTARFGTGWMPFAPTPQGLKRRLQQFAQLLTAHGRMINEVEIIPSLLFQFGKNKVEARKQLPVWGKPPQDLRAIFGNAEDCLERIQEYAQAGATQLTLRLIHPANLDADLSEIASEILPKF